MEENIIYLIECVGDEETKYKIGYTKDELNLKRRLKAIQTGNPYKCSICNTFNTKHYRKIETTLHNTHIHKRLEGEWFVLDLEDVVHFTKNCEDIEKRFDLLKESNNPYY